jgi:ribosomal protein S5
MGAGVGMGVGVGLAQAARKTVNKAKWSMLHLRLGKV